MIPKLLRQAVLIAGAFCLYFSAGAQTVYWPSPEVEQMYNQAKQYLSQGAVKRSIVLFQQALQLAPDIMVLRRDLAQALSLAQSYDEAVNTLEPIIKDGQADEQTYYIAGASYISLGEKKKAKNVLEKGLGRYPNSGLLYNQLGKYYESTGESEYALDSWLRGIELDPGYHMNYYEAAMMYSTTDRLIWAILYGEVFANLERQTNRSLETRKMVMNAYEKLFSTLGTTPLPKASGNGYGTDTSFELAVLQTYRLLSPVLSDGATTDNLTMLRTRFAMDWANNWSAKYPYSIFSYYDKLLRAGQFDAYNQWMFGNAENPAGYDGWVKFHPEALPSLEAWTAQHPYRATASDFYNNKDLRSLFQKNKSKNKS